MTTTLTLTDSAADLVHRLTEQLPDGGGLRIDVNPVFHSLTMGLAAAPQEQDGVVADCVFLTPVAMERLRDRTLDATDDVFWLAD